MARPPASAEAREQRINQLLDAAVSLWLQHPERIPSVAEVADEAGLAKGTVYLYFKSKEDLLLAVHERHAQTFFTALIACASKRKRMNFDDMMRLTHEHIVGVPAFLPRATLVAGLMHKGVSPETAQAFEQRMAGRLGTAGELLRAHFPLPDGISGVRLLMRSYALILGLWQLVGNCRPECADDEVSAMMRPDYLTELDAALRALWKGTFNKESSHA
ncbi:MAG: TetR/AcrR family transcriptional regulator [Nitrosomonadales bacterium]|nr:TetR/AcrR family transcriptional regulator [Nitrosomonadales bacterium]